MMFLVLFLSVCIMTYSIDDVILKTTNDFSSVSPGDVLPYSFHGSIFLGMRMIAAKLSSGAYSGEY